MADDDPVGIITRIALKNFVTYDDVVVKPGKNLNLIIGPNGTGKSTIVSAIVLGLGGSPKVIGRAPHIGSYVKAGQTTATIEIDLQNGVKKVVTITRQFNDQNHTNWFVNHKSSNCKVVGDLMKTFNIQVDNLCQFLPQDKVQEFSNLSPQQLLIETERSVGDPKLLEYHIQLKDFRETQAKLETSLESHIRLLAKEKQTCDSLKDKVGHIQEQKTIEKKLKSLKQKKAWVIYSDKNDEFRAALVERDNAKKTKEILEKKLKPIQQEISKLKTSIHNLEKTAKQHNSETIAKSTKLNKLQDDIENVEKFVDDAEKECQIKIKEEQETDERIAVLVEQKNKFENDLKHKINEVGSVEAIGIELESISKKLNEDKNNLGNLKAQQNFLYEKIEHCTRKMKGEEQNLQEVQNIENKRLDLLHRISKDAYNGVLWLRSNKHLFSKPIHEPILLLINVKDANYAKYFESIIPYRDLTAFVCEDKKDMNLLLRYLRDQQKLRINAVHSDPDREVNDQPDVSLQNLRQFGFEYYLLSLISAPRIILNYLIHQYNLHRIPVGNDNVVKNLEYIPDVLRLFFSTDKLFSINRSKYSGEKSVTQTSTSSKNLLSITVDSERISSIQNQLSTLEEERKSYEHQYQALHDKIAQEEEKANSHKQIRRKLEMNMGSIKELQNKIIFNGKKIQERQKNRKSVDDIRVEYKSKIQVLISDQLLFYQNLCKKLDDYYKSIIINEEMKLQVKLQKNQLAVKESDSHEMREEYENAERNFRNLENEMRPLKQELEKLFEEAKQMTDGISCEDETLFLVYQNIFAKLPVSLEEIISAIQKTQAKAFSVNDKNEAQRILNQFSTAKKNVEKLTKDINSEEQELIKVTEDISKVKEEWLPSLNSLVDKINKNFSSCFTKMKCAGEVSLTDEGSPLDFAKYGLRIKVKFRDADELQALSRNHQSGGERSVTTAAYMISLQELTRVPFRCVDEINQGMDAANERRVFELIVNITSMSNSAQYFLLTPKLLPDLKYNDSMTVLTVFNGKYMAPSSQFDIQDNIDSICSVIKNRQCAER